ncbi:hypothetical protein [Hymenobacter koreensis]|uniref:hypothetical protein n=1 Tax=Hymenobacter koreensis TaxID=1084523 RepID=UPI0031E5AF1E
MKVFDYFFYRVAKTYYKNDGVGAATAVVGLSALQFLLITILGLSWIGFVLGGLASPNHSKTWGNAAIVVCTLLLVYNSFRYYNKYPLLAKRWEQESKKQKRVRGILIILAIPLVFAIMVLIMWLIQTKPHSSL